MVLQYIIIYNAGYVYLCKANLLKMRELYFVRKFHNGGYPPAWGGSSGRGDLPKIFFLIFLPYFWMLSYYTCHPRKIFQEKTQS